MLKEKAILYTWNEKDNAYENIVEVKRVGTSTRSAKAQNGEVVEYLIHFFQLNDGTAISTDEIDYTTGGWMPIEDFAVIANNNDKRLKWILNVEKKLVVKEGQGGGAKPTWLK